MNLNAKLDSEKDLKISDWDLDFYSRPIIEKNGKKHIKKLILK